MKHIKKRKTRFILILCLLLIIGFSSISFVSYFVANNSLNQYIRANTLPLTSDNIYSEIQRDVLPTVIISSLMAQDTFVRDWILDGEQNIDQITNYLLSIQQRYKTETAFFISDDTRNYYHSTGLIKQVSINNSADDWYFLISGSQDNYDINVDIDAVDKQKTNIFINYKIFDYNGGYLGIIGVGLSSERVKELIEYYQTSYNSQVYFADLTGQVTLSHKQLTTLPNLHQSEGISDIADEILQSPSGSFTYMRQEQEVFLNTRFVPELGWYLLVEQIGKPEAHIQKTLWINLFVSFIITTLVLILGNLTIRKYQHRLIMMATHDKLTGINNRHGFEPILTQSIKIAARNKQALSMVLVDIDHFKAINDQYGHISGDTILTQFAETLSQNLRDSDSLCRWGGEEFIFLLADCNAGNAMHLAEKIRLAINATPFEINGEKIIVSASFGLSQYIIGESKDNLIARADSALYRAKTQGRNCVEQA